MLFRAHSAAAAPRRYDLKAKKDFFKEAKLAGAIADVKYVLTHAIEKGVTGVTLMSKQVGHNLKAVGDTSSYLTTLSAKGTASLAGYDIDYEPAFNVKTKTTKLALSAALGGGVSATGVVTASSAGAVSADYELGYEHSLGDVRRAPFRAPACAPTPAAVTHSPWRVVCAQGRELSATLNPAERAGEVEIIDSFTERGATWVASAQMALGSKPKVTLRRSMKL